MQGELGVDDEAARAQGPRAKVILGTRGTMKCLKARDAFAAGTAICAFAAREVYHAPTRYTVQRGLHAHITLEPELLQYINHSCDPNIYFDFETNQLVALRDISTGEELCFFYPSTEWDMQEPFACACQTPRCTGQITGASALSSGVMATYACSPFIRAQLRQRDVTVASP